MTDPALFIDFEDPEKTISGFDAIPKPASFMDRLLGRTPAQDAPAPAAASAFAIDFEDPEKTIAGFAPAEDPQPISLPPQPRATSPEGLPAAPAADGPLPPSAAFPEPGPGETPRRGPDAGGSSAIGDMMRTVENIGLVYPAAETAASLASNLYALPASGLAGLAGLATGNPETADKWRETVYNLTAYQPQTQRGQELTETAMLPFEMLRRGATAAGEKTLETTGSPAAATAVHTAIEGLPALLTRKRAGRLAEAVKQSDWYRQATIKERGLVAQSLAETLEKNPNLKEADLVRRSERYYREAKQRRQTPEAETPKTAAPEPKAQRPAPELKTELAKAFKAELDAAPKERPLARLAASETALAQPPPNLPVDPQPPAGVPALSEPADVRESRTTEPDAAAIPGPSADAPALPEPQRRLPEGQGFSLVGRPYGATEQRPVTAPGEPPGLPAPERGQESEISKEINATKFFHGTDSGPFQKFDIS